MSSNSPRVLLLSPFFFPEKISTGKYNTFLAEALADNGYDVTVVCSHPLYPSWMPEVSDAKLESIIIQRGGGNIHYPGSNILRRLVLELWYAWHVFKNIFKNRKSFDYVIPVFPPSLFFLLTIALLASSTKKVGIVHDLQGVYAKRQRTLASSLINVVIKYVEAKCFSCCDRVIFLSHSMADRATSDYSLNESDVRICYPFITLNEYSSTTNDLALTINSESVNVVYSGALSEKQNPFILLKFMENLMSCDARIRCHIFSEGPVFAELSQKSSVVGFHDLVSTDQIGELYSRSSVQIIPQANGTADGSLPSKLPNLMASGVPIFAICEPGSEVGHIVNLFDAGVVAESWNVEELTKSFIVSFAKFFDEPRDHRTLRQRNMVSERFSVDNVLKVLAEL